MLLKQHKLNLKYVSQYIILIKNNDFEALKFSGVAAVLLAAFFSYQEFCRRQTNQIHFGFGKNSLYNF